MDTGPIPLKEVVLVVDRSVSETNFLVVTNSYNKTIDVLQGFSLVRMNIGYACILTVG